MAYVHCHGHHRRRKTYARMLGVQYTKYIIMAEHTINSPISI